MHSAAVASNIMSKYGWKEGQGLGRQSQGMSTALAVEKTSKRGGKIINVAAEREQQLAEEKKKAQSLTDVMRKPTKVVLLKNMVGPGEVDEDLQPETTEECSKYGDVANCLVYEIPHGVDESEAVRIFVQFTRLESAIKGTCTHAVSYNVCTYYVLFMYSCGGSKWPVFWWTNCLCYIFS
jgi:splicing factor 45